MHELQPSLAIAIQHHKAGRLRDAEEIYQRILAVQPNQPDALNLLGVLAAQSGRTDAGIEYFQRAISVHGNVAALHNNLGNAYRQSGRNAEAAACFRRAIELKPDFAEAHNNLGLALRQEGKLEEAIASYRRAIELAPGDAEAHYNLGHAWKALGNLAEAAGCFRRAVGLKPKFPRAHGALGRALEKMGDLKEAEASYQTALQYDPRNAYAHLGLARILGGGLPAEQLDAQRRLLAETGITDADQALVHFGLAQVLDARGEFAEAAEHLQRANALELSESRLRGEAFDPEAAEQFVSRMISVCTPEFFEQVRGFGSESEVPVFVFGLPRSGTTLLEQILGSHSQVFAAGELQLAGSTLAALGEEGDLFEGLARLDQETARLLAAQYLERLRALAPAALRIVDKMPHNYLYLGLLARLFPRARFIHCRRDLRDVAVSCWMTHFKSIRWTNDPRHIALQFRLYRRVMEHWRQCLPSALLEVDYDETVADLEGVARRLVAWCSLEWEHGCLEFHRGRRVVSTASSVQVRRPIYATSVGRWRNYAKRLPELFEAVEGVEEG